MECNRDEAVRAKSIAESKIEQKDFFGAKKFALKAQTLYPGLDGISQMLTTLDVYVSAENKINGEVDWYGVLGVNPSDDDETIKKNYRKLALMLHPDKNSSIGADGAFKLILEAWNFLSDKAKRLQYNQRRGIRGFQQRVPTYTTGGPSVQTGVARTGSHPSVHTGVAPSARTGGRPPPSHTGGYPSAHAGAPSAHTGGPAAHAGGPSPGASPFFNFTSRTTAAPKSQKRRAKRPSTPALAPSHQRSDTFWTICRLCSMQYEYLRIYLNGTLLCPNCNKPFRALETAPPRVSKSSKPIPWQRKQNSNENLNDPGRNLSAAQKSGAGQWGQNSFSYANYQQVPLSGTPNINSTDPSIAAEAVIITHVKTENPKRKRAVSRTSAGWEGGIKKGKPDDGNSGYGMNRNMAQGHSGFGTTNTTGSSYGMNANMAQGFSGFGTKNETGSSTVVMNPNVAQGFGNTSATGSRIYGFPGTYRQPNSTRELTPTETRKLLISMAQKEILKKLNESRAETTAKAAYEVKDKSKESSKERERKKSNSQRPDNNLNSGLPATQFTVQAEKHPANCSADSESKEYPAAMTMNVPDPDFHDFDQDRCESSFADNEVWAAYDDDDGMPRFYALIKEVISRKPFKLKISWLNSKTTSEFSTIGWVGSGFHKTCGEFRVGKNEICRSINAFSQRVNWSKGPRGTVIILPQKGDVWALYRNWSFDWNENTLDEVVHKYDMVIVLDDYSEEHGASVAPLVKVVGFRTVFLPNLDAEVIKRIPKEEMFRFSHRVPSHLLTSQESQNAPKGCLELDPAATPLELLQMITETNEDPVIPNRSNDEKCVVKSTPVISLDKIVGGTGEPQAVNVQEQSPGKVAKGKETWQRR